MSKMETLKYPKVSIIMGIYNCAKTLDEAIESILAQTYTNWNMVMCDDGSTDATYLIAQKYVQRYPGKFILLKNRQNRGLNYTLNRCLKASDGRLIARMDGDDISLPTRLEKEVRFLMKHPEIAFVSTATKLFDESGDWGQTRGKKYPQKKDFYKGRALFCHAACMIRREVFFEVRGYTVSPRLLRVEDQHLWFKIYAAGYRGANIPEILYKVRDDHEATQRRTWQNRKNGCYVQYIGFRMMKMPVYTYWFVLINSILELAKGMLPDFVYEALHRRMLRPRRKVRNAQ